MEVFPIPPMPLRLLCESADLIAVVRTGEPCLNSKVENHSGWNTHQVELEVLQVLHGEAKGDSIWVGFNPNMVCPSPANFISGKTPLVFLQETEGDEYETVGLHYGTKELLGEALNAYTSAVQQWVEIQTLGSEDRHLAMVEWLTSLAENPHTRWEGAFEFDHERSYFADDVIKKVQLDYPYSTLRPEQITRLVSALCKANSLDYKNQALLRVLKNETDPHLDEFLRRVLEKLEYDLPRRSGYWIHLMAKRSQNPKAIQFFDRHWKPARYSLESDWNFQGESWERILALQDLLNILRPR
jgi:hypothetical protein